MDYVIAEFSDLTVSSVPKKWQKKNGKKKRMWFPTSNALAKIKAAVDVDENSKKWRLHSYRLLMNGATFSTYEEARAAEIIAQSHSTMESFEKSYMKKQKARKRPVVNFSSSAPSSSNESESSDFKKIKKLQKVDAELKMNAEKEYDYVNPMGRVEDWIVSNRSGADKDRRQTSYGSKKHFSESHLSSSEKSAISSKKSDAADDKVSSKKSDAADDDVSTKTSDAADDDVSSKKSDAADDDVSSKKSDAADDDVSSKKSDAADDAVSSKKSDSSDDDVSSKKSDAIEGNCLNENGILLTGPDSIQLPFESTNVDSVDVISDYNNFNVGRRIQYIERTLKSANEQLTENKKLLTETMESLKDIKCSLGGLTQTIKDLAVEVFDSKAELKKRNGLFTDLLAPQIRLPIKNLNRYANVECELLYPNIVDNVIKFLGSTINESNENGFIKACLKIVFTNKFLLKKVWWKNEPEKAFFKKSQLLHCIRESYKMKFGLVEPKKSDKSIDGLIHKIHTTMKDTMRKAMKAEKAKQAENDKKMNEAFEEEYQLERAKRTTEQVKHVDNAGDYESKCKKKKTKKPAEQLQETGEVDPDGKKRKRRSEENYQTDEVDGNIRRKLCKKSKWTNEVFEETSQYLPTNKAGVKKHRNGTSSKKHKTKRNV